MSTTLELHVTGVLIAFRGVVTYTCPLYTLDCFLSFWLSCFLSSLPVTLSLSLLSVSLCVYHILSLFVFLFTLLGVSLSLHLFLIHLSFSLSLSLSLSLSVSLSLSLCLSLSLSLSPSLVHPNFNEVSDIVRKGLRVAGIVFHRLRDSIGDNMEIALE